MYQGKVCTKMYTMRVHNESTGNLRYINLHLLGKHTYRIQNAKNFIK